jgi:hypothetical protein
MTMKRIFAAALLLFMAGAGFASVQYSFDPSQVPQPATTVPSTESNIGAVGTVNAYALANHSHPRISRSTTVSTASDGTFSVTWATALPSAPDVILTPVGTGSVAIHCQLTAVPTVTAVAGKCFTQQNTLLSLSIITTGLTLSPFASSTAGISVQVIAIPPSQ